VLGATGLHVLEKRGACVNTLSRQSQRLLQIGIGLLLFVSFEGFVIPLVAAPRLGLSAHTLGALESVLLLALGLAWTRLRLGDVASRVAFWLLVYSTFAILAAYVLGAFWGAGNETMPISAGVAHGSPIQESVIKVVAYSSAPTGIVAFVLIIWGLRLTSEPGQTA
jgi:(hydroxyamino)benzene mutase